jgi:hypothetical protein
MNRKQIEKIVNRQCMKLVKMNHPDANWSLVSASDRFSWCFKTLRGVENWLRINNKLPPVKSY